MKNAWTEKIEQLEKEIEGLKKELAYANELAQDRISVLEKRLANIKYLGYKKVKEVLLNHILTKEEPDEITISFRSKRDGKKYGIITSIYDLAVRICSFALPTKEKIKAKILEHSHPHFKDNEFDNKIVISSSELDNIANEILGDDKNE